MKMIPFCRIIWIFSLFVAILLCLDVDGLKCLQCNSHKNIDCYKGISEPKECSSSNHTFCITYSGYLKESGVHLIFRNCSTSNLTSECQNMPVKSNPAGGPEHELRFCSHTCDTNGCNRDLHPTNAAPRSSCSKSAVNLFSGCFALALLALPWI